MADFTARFIRKKSVQLALGLLVVCAGLIIWQINRPVPAENLLADPGFNDATLANWRVASQGSGVASVADNMLTLSIPDSGSGSWIGVGQKQPVARLQHYSIAFDYSLLEPVSSPNRVVLRVAQYNPDGVLLNSEEISNIEPLQQTAQPTTFQHRFSTMFNSHTVEIGVGLLGQNSTSVQVRNVNLTIAPTWSSQLMASPVALAASGVAILALGYIIGQACWLVRHKIMALLNGLVASQFFSLKEVGLIFFGFWGIVFLSNLLVKHIICDYIVSFDCPLYWPVSMVSLRWPDIYQVFTAIAVLLLFLVFIKYFPRGKVGLITVMLAGFMTIMGSTLTQGWYNGFVWPIIEDRADRGTQYYHDTKDFESIADILKTFHARVHDLHQHARVHPPGPLVTMFVLYQIFNNFSLITIAMALVSTGLTMFFMFNILSAELSPQTALFVTFLFILIPSVQIYFATTIDALVAAFLLGFLYFYNRHNQWLSVLGSTLSLFLASALTFGFVAILPIVFGVDLLKRNVVKPTIILAGFCLIYGLIYLTFGFNYLEAFFTAVHIENVEFTHGFLLFSAPVSYFFTRIEGVFEVFLFFGPFLTILMVRGFRQGGFESRLMKMALLTFITLGALFLYGSFRTGETARVDLFAYPYLMFPVAILLKNMPPTTSEQNSLLVLVYSQTILMQLFGFYLW